MVRTEVRFLLDLAGTGSNRGREEVAWPLSFKSSLTQPRKLQLYLRPLLMQKAPFRLFPLHRKDNVKFLSKFFFTFSHSILTHWPPSQSYPPEWSTTLLHPSPGLGGGTVSPWGFTQSRYTARHWVNSACRAVSRLNGGRAHGNQGSFSKVGPRTASPAATSGFSNLGSHTKGQAQKATPFSKPILLRTPVLYKLQSYPGEIMVKICLLRKVHQNKLKKII